MNILIGCEESQVVTMAFRALGHNAFSCDLKPCSGGHPEWHLQMDVFEAIAMNDWDLGIFFPDCTYLTCSAEWAYKDGPYHQKVKPGTLVGEPRRQARNGAEKFFLALYNSKIPRVAIENPIGVMSSRFRKPDQVIQPHYFGDDASKGTCLWLKNFPGLIHVKEPNLFEKETTWVSEGKVVNGYPAWMFNNDKKHRSKTFPGIAKAMATQWGEYLNKL